MATEEVSNLRKGLNLEGLIQNLDRVEDIDYWRRIDPTVSISEYPFRGLENSQTVSPEVLESQAAWLREEGYFQTDPMVPAAMLREMAECIDVVRKAGFPPLFALVYDAFHVAFRHFHPIIKNIIGETYYIIPNYWVYYIEPSDAGKGFEPHRDAEYPDTIDASGMPTVITLWVAVTDATPLNSCMYLVPRTATPITPGPSGGCGPRQPCSPWKTSGRCSPRPGPSRAGTNTSTTGAAVAANARGHPASVTPCTASGGTCPPSMTR